MSKTSKFTTVLTVVFIVVFVWIFREWRTSVFYDVQRFTLVAGKETLTIFTFNKSDQSFLLIDLPRDIYLRSGFGYGYLPIRSIYGVGQLDRRGESTVKNTILANFGLAVDIYSPKDLAVESSKISFKDLLPVFFDRQVNKIDFVGFLMSWWKTPSDQKKLITVNQQSGLVAQLDPSIGQELLGVSIDDFDQYISTKLETPDFRQEGWRVGIVNAGDLSGLGAFASRILDLQGVNVISIDTQEKMSDFEQCLIEYSNKSVEKSKTVKLISKMFSCEEMMVSSLSPRYDIVLTVNANFGKAFGF